MSGFQPRVFSLTLLLGVEAEVLRDSDLQLLMLANLVGPLGSPILMDGLITLLTPVVRFRYGVQLAGLSVAVIVAVGGTACLLLGRESERIGLSEPDR